MSEDLAPYRALAEIADTNPDTLPASTHASDRIRYVDLSAVNEGFIEWNEVPDLRFSDAPSRARRVVKAGDVLFGTVRPNLRSHGYVDALRWNAVVASTGFSVIRAKEGISHPRYLFHCALSEQIRLQANRNAVGSSYPALNDSDVRQFMVFAPVFREQAKIAEVLDTLDTAIRQTEAIIAKLRLVKQGLLHDLLTRGIDANGELRPPQSQAPHLYKSSPLGWIPKEWEYKPFGELCESSAFGPRFPSDAYDENGPLATLRTTDMDDEGNISLSTMPRAAITPSTFADHLLRPGDIVISRSGTCGVTGVFTGHDIPVVPGAFLIRFRLRDPRLNAFYRRYFNSALGRPLLARLAVGGVQKNIKGSDVLNLVVPTPPPAEAVGIAERIEASERDIDLNLRVQAKLNREKSGLMDDLLTGRVRVAPLLDIKAPS